MANIGTLVEYVAYADPSITGKSDLFKRGCAEFSDSGRNHRTAQRIKNHFRYQ